MLKFILILLLSVLQVEAAPRKKTKAKAKTALLTQQERQTAVTTCKEFLANAFKPTQMHCQISDCARRVISGRACHTQPIIMPEKPH